MFLATSVSIFGNVKIYLIFTFNDRACFKVHFWEYLMLGETAPMVELVAHHDRWPVQGPAGCTPLKSQ
eukprot:SAG11_NODE_2714_length_3052_cov_1.918727_4_plen_68_part_00